MVAMACAPSSDVGFQPKAPLSDEELGQFDDDVDDIDRLVDDSGEVVVDLHQNAYLRQAASWQTTLYNALRRDAQVFDVASMPKPEGRTPGADLPPLISDLAQNYDVARSTVVGHRLSDTHCATLGSAAPGSAAPGPATPGGPATRASLEAIKREYCHHCKILRYLLGAMAASKNAGWPLPKLSAAASADASGLYAQPPLSSLNNAITWSADAHPDESCANHTAGVLRRLLEYMERTGIFVPVWTVRAVMYGLDGASGCRHNLLRRFGSELAEVRDFPQERGSYSHALLESGFRKRLSHLEWVYARYPVLQTELVLHDDAEAMDASTLLMRLSGLRYPIELPPTSLSPDQEQIYSGVVMAAHDFGHVGQMARQLLPHLGELSLAMDATAPHCRIDTGEVLGKTDDKDLERLAEYKRQSAKETQRITGTGHLYYLTNALLPSSSAFREFALQLPDSVFAERETALFRAVARLPESGPSGSLATVGGVLDRIHEESVGPWTLKSHWERVAAWADANNYRPQQVGLQLAVARD